LRASDRVNIVGPWFLLPVAVIVAALALAPASQLTGYPILEDGYYSLSIARQIALGHGVTVDGSTRTNGFQPLWVFLVVPLYAMTSGQRILTLRFVLCCSGVLWIGTALVLAKLSARLTAHSRAAAMWTVILYLTSRTILEQHFNGLETGLMLFVFAALASVTNSSGWTTARTIAVASICGILVLSRIDTALFVVLFTFVLARFPRSDPWRARLTRAAAVAAGSALVSLPWWLYNQIGFGSLLPSSGSAVFDWHWTRGRALVLALYAAGHGVPLPVRPFWRWRYEWCAAAIIALTLLMALWRIHGRLERVVNAMDTYPWARMVAALAMYVGLIIVAYAMTPAYWMYERYTSPVVVLSVPALAVALAETIGMRGAFVGASAALLCLVVGVREQVASPLNGAFQNQVSVVRRHVPDGLQVGALQSGTLGYFRDNVVNLDGKVNAAALRARGHLDDYLRNVRVDWIADWPWLLKDGLESLDDWQLIEQVNAPECPPCGFALYERRRR
jgi:hypothetical protein